MGTSAKVMRVLAIVAVLTSVGYANWSDSFDGGKLNLHVDVRVLPPGGGHLKQTITAGEAGNDYLTFTETTGDGPGRVGLLGGFRQQEKFKDVRVAATVNVAGDARYDYYGLLARASYFIDRRQVDRRGPRLRGGRLHHARRLQQWTREPGDRHRESQNESEHDG